jgi:hypothetical protein
MPNKMERFSQRARRVLSLAQEEAERLQHSYIGAEHLLVGLMREEGGTASRVLHDLGLDLRRVQELVERLTRATTRTTATQLDLAPDTKKVLELAVDEARRMKQLSIETEHLLLGLVRLPEGVALEVLKRLGVSLDEIRQRIDDVMEKTPKEEDTPSAPANPPEPSEVPESPERRLFQQVPFVTHEERQRILQMVEDGKISADEGAKLLNALQFPTPYITTYLRVIFSQLYAIGETAYRRLRVVISDPATNAVKTEFRLPMKTAAECIEALLDAVLGGQADKPAALTTEHGKIEIFVEEDAPKSPAESGQDG